MNDKAYATTLSDSNSSNSDLEDSCDKEGTFSTVMTIAHVESLVEFACARTWGA